MKESSTATGEDGRLAALAEYDILDTPNEAVFDALARVAAKTCGASIGLISLVGADTLSFVANFGLPGMSAPRDGSFCTIAIQGDGIFEVADARLDPRFASHPYVTGEPYVRFYAAVPLLNPSGLALGTVSVADSEPRTLSAEQRAGLVAIGDAVVEQFESRRRTVSEQAEVTQRLKLLSAALEASHEAVAITRMGPAIDDPVAIVYAGARGRDRHQRRAVHRSENGRFGHQAHAPGAVPR
jgi:GAF domain-containing protein